MKKVVIEQPLGRILSHTGKAFLAILNHKLRNLDIDRNYFALLLIHEGGGNLNQQELACSLGTDKVTVVRIVDYLSSAGYVERIRSREDRRRYGLLVTPKAVKAIPSIQRAISEAHAVIFDGIPDARQQEIKKTLQQMKSNLDQYNKNL
jgi:DNA-binding MarR family transcriptional regulator